MLLHGHVTDVVESNKWLNSYEEENYVNLEESSILINKEN
jgi:hypothetical protein